VLSGGRRAHLDSRPPWLQTSITYNGENAMPDQMTPADRDCLVAAILTSMTTSNQHIGPTLAVERFAVALKEIRKKGGTTVMWHDAAPPPE